MPHSFCLQKLDDIDFKFCAKLQLLILIAKSPLGKYIENRPYPVLSDLINNFRNRS